MKLDYEYVKGFHGFLEQELTRPDFTSSPTTSKIYGIGMQYFPRPHIDVSLTWEIQTRATSLAYTDFAYLMLHFYP